MLSKLIQSIKYLTRDTYLYEILWRARRHIEMRKEMRNWKKQGGSDKLPQLMKQKIVKEYAKKFTVESFVETGTYLGEMVYAVKDIFRNIVSIELDETLYRQAVARLARFRHISLIQDDSANILADVLANVHQPCLFWLDAHFSSAKGYLKTPVMQELLIILNHPTQNHVILIDDARFFKGEHDFPTIHALKTLIYEKRPECVFEIKDDIIRIHKRD